MTEPGAGHVQSMLPRVVNLHATDIETIWARQHRPYWRAPFQQPCRITACSQPYDG
jgi:hypothetical protein